MGFLDVYLYGMTVWSTVHRLAGKYPVQDTYGEIKETHHVVGGETGNAAILLSSFGLKTRVDGPYLGIQTSQGVRSCFDRYSIDTSGLILDESFTGVEDLVLVDDQTRTVFGRFAGYLSGPERWRAPDADAIRCAKTVSIDPFFRESSQQAAELSVVAGKPYVTMDCPHDGYLHAQAASTVISNEFLQREYPGVDSEDAFALYSGTTRGLVILTFGKREILFGRCGEKIERMKPFEVKVEGTLGAGDAFRAGVVYGIHQGWKDEEVVHFATATAAMACMKNPIALQPPTLDEVTYLMASGKTD
jgi:sugar/nucleoside kinase (ribokinase family)